MVYLTTRFFRRDCAANRTAEKGVTGKHAALHVICDTLLFWKLRFYFCQYFRHSRGRCRGKPDFLRVERNVWTIRAKSHTAAWGNSHPTRPAAILYFFLQQGLNGLTVAIGAWLSGALAVVCADEYMAYIRYRLFFRHFQTVGWTATKKQRLTQIRGF